MKIPKILQTKIEAQLRPRLRVIGTILFCFATAALLYAFFAEPYTLSEEDITKEIETELSAGLFIPEASPPLTLTSDERVGCFAITAIFSLIGLLCFRASYKRQV